MRRFYLAVLLALIAVSVAAVSIQDLDWLLTHADHAILQRYASQAESLLLNPEISQETLNKLLEYSQRADRPFMQNRVLLRLAWRYRDFDAALELIRLQQAHSSLNGRLIQMLAHRVCCSSADSLSIAHLQGTMTDSLFVAKIAGLESYNGYIEARAKELVDTFSVERSDSLALALIREFENDYPKSQYRHYGYYNRLYHLLQSQSYAQMDSLIAQRGLQDHAHAYVSALYLLNQRYLGCDENAVGHKLDLAQMYLQQAAWLFPQDGDSEVLYIRYSSDTWLSRIRMNQVKLEYQRLKRLAQMLPKQRFDTPLPELGTVLDLAKSVRFANNDMGEQAELAFWQGQLWNLALDPASQQAAARLYLECLIKGAPRNSYCQEALNALRDIHRRLEINTGFDQWCRDLAGYTGIVFDDATLRMGLDGKRHTRIAIADYDNDGWLDLLFDGSRIYHNREGSFFEDLSDSLNTSGLTASGGLWADFNQDGLLDFVSISHGKDGAGDALMKNHQGKRFINVNERAGDIDDAFPSEAAAWIDVANTGYPSLYVANYETWQERKGYPDRFWLNQAGYFEEQGKRMGLRSAPDMDNPGLAGRGVAPADFNDDGLTDILVTNYRLNRNFLFKNSPSGFEDMAFQCGVAGNYSQGYYGHSIGADWGDYDNDGDLDLFIANLAHPRFLAFSDISMLLRNDGPAQYTIGDETFTYHKFTDVTKDAGISFDELHSDPLWADFDNDGNLDLFISSVYENDRSYLYRNNGDGTFSDITWLSGARVFNGWGNACGDLNRDGLPDLVVGSGNGCKILINATPTANRSVFVKPIWEKGQVLLLESPDQFGTHPNSPAFGTRVGLNIVQKDGSIKTLIREMNSAKGTCSQNAPELHFGIGEAKTYTIERVGAKK